jgi:subtilase family serine protease
MKMFNKKTKENYGEMLSAKDIVMSKHSSTRDPVVIDKLKKVTPFLSVLRDKGMTYREIAEILEVLTGMDIDPNRVRNYVTKANPPTIHITITDREDDGA